MPRNRGRKIRRTMRIKKKEPVTEKLVNRSVVERLSRESKYSRMQGWNGTRWQNITVVENADGKYTFPMQAYNGTNYHTPRIDTSTRTLQTIDYAHHEIHGGSHYYIQGYIELNDTDTFYMKMVTPNTTKWSHFIFHIQSTGICSSTLDEDATGGMTGGALVIPINNNRNSAKTSGMVLIGGVTACTGYTTRLENDKWGADGFKENIGGGSGRNDELILKQNTVYCRSFVSGANDNIIQFKASWYEHENASV